MVKKILRFLKLIYLKLFRINDNPQKIALGIGLGVFSGVLPGTGLIAALFLAFIFKVNRAAALLGSVLTNTWLSIPVFFISVKAGSLITGSNYGDICRELLNFSNDFNWTKLFHISVYKIAVPVAAGYAFVSLCIAITAYAVTFAVVIYARNKKMRLKKV